MDYRIKKTYLYNLLLAICIAVPYLGNYELTFATWCTGILLTVQNRFSYAFLKYTLCFAVIVLIAFLSSDYSNFNPFLYIRDITYLIKPVVGLILGYQLCKYVHKDVFKTLVGIGFIISVIHILIMLDALIVKGVRNVHDLRFYGGYFSDFEVYALIILMFHKSFGIDLSRRHFYIGVTVIGLSSFLYLARSNFIQFFILLMAMKGYFVLNRRSIIAFASATIAVLIAYSAVLYINPKRNGKGFEAFLYKVKVAPIEPFKKRVNTRDYIDFNDNYRSVELNLTLHEVSSEGPMAVLFGKGLGSQVDLRQEVYLGDMLQRYISVLHNSFMTVYLKSGLVGVAILCYSIFMLFRPARSNIPIMKQVNYLLVGTAVFLLVSNWVLMGYYFTQDSKSMLVGIFFAYKAIHSRSAKIEESPV